MNEAKNKNLFIRVSEQEKTIIAEQRVMDLRLVLRTLREMTDIKEDRKSVV